MQFQTFKEEKVTNLLLIQIYINTNIYYKWKNERKFLSWERGDFVYEPGNRIRNTGVLLRAKWFFDKELEIYDLVALPGGEVVKKLLRELEKGETSKTAVIKLAFEYLRELGKEEKIVVFIGEI